MTWFEYEVILNIAEGIINSRPLVKVENQEGQEIITPYHFLIKKPGFIPPNFKTSIIP
jgi:hypothetical protein